MSSTLQSITLPDFVMEPDYGWSGVASNVERTILGKMVLTEQEIDGRPFDLIGGAQWGWMSRNILMQVLGLSQTAYAVYTLTYEGTIYNVRFRNEDGGEPVSAEVITPRPNHANTDLYNNVRIKLMEV